MNTNYRTSYHAEFPLAEMLSVPAGWIVRFVSRWREGSPDASWRLVLKRTKE